MPLLQTRPRTRRRTAESVLAFTAVFALLMLAWAAIFAANGSSFIQYGDTLKQHYAFLMYYGRWLRQAVRCLLTGAAIPTWDASIGYGADVVTTFSYYGLGDPLDLLAGLVPSSLTEQLLEGLIVLRLYLAGLTFTAFSLHHGNSRFGTLLGAVAYTFSAWPLRAGLIEPIFLVPMYCFPLVLLGADLLFEQRRPLLFVVSVALAALSNFLFFYMIVALTVCYVAALYGKRSGLKNLRTLPPLLGRFVLYGAVGTAIAGVTLLPTALELFSGTRFGADRSVVGYPFRRFFDLFANMTTTMEYDAYSSYTGITAVAFLGVLVLFARPRRHTILKAAWLAMLALLLVPQAGSLLNGLSYVSNRWVWAFAMLEAFILARVCPGMTRFAPKEKLILFVLLAGYCLAAFGYREARGEAQLFGSVLLLLLAVWLLAADGGAPRLTRWVLLAGCCLGVVANLGYYYGAEEGDAVQEYYAPGYAWQTSVVGNPAVALQGVEDGGYWRYDSALNEPINSAMLLGRYGTGFFFSLNNSSLSQLFAELGQNTPTEYDYRGLQNRTPLETLFGVAYYLYDPGNPQTLPPLFDRQPELVTDVGGVNVAISRNEAALPTGYTASARITRQTYEALSPLARQDALLDGVLLEDGAGTSLPEAQLTGDTVRPEAERTLDGVEQLDETTYYAPRDGGTITFTISNPVPDCETALVVQGMEYTATNPLDAMGEELLTMSAHDRLQTRRQYAHFWCKDSVYLRLISNLGEGRLDYSMPNSQYYCGRHDFVYNFGTSEEGLTTLTIVLPFAGYYTFTDLAVECQRLDRVKSRAAELSRMALQDVTVGTNRISGTVEADTPRVLVLQVPYSQGWSVTVDGQPAELLRADTAFLGVELTAGSHTVDFTYRTPGLGAGVLFSTAGLLGLLAVAVAGRRRRR